MVQQVEQPLFGGGGACAKVGILDHQAGGQGGRVKPGKGRGAQGHGPRLFGPDMGQMGLARAFGAG